MQLEMIKQGRHYIAHPDCFEAIEAMDPWRRHAAYHDACRQVYAPEREPTPSDMAEKGVEVFPGQLSRDTSAELSTLMGTVLEEAGPNGGAHGPVPDMPDEPCVTVPTDPRTVEAIGAVMDKIFSVPLTDAIEAYLGCHFRIDSSLLYRTHCVADRTISFLWHRDIAPLAQVHIMVYLTPGGSEYASTHFLDLDQTRRAAQAGYSYTKLKTRIDDITEFVEDADVLKIDMAPGDAVVFAAPRVLHRGWLPTGEPRDVLLFVLQPSLVPWNYETEDFGCSHLILSVSKNTLSTNPFAMFHPNIPAEMTAQIPAVEDWVTLGQFVPS